MAAWLGARRQWGKNTRCGFELAPFVAILAGTLSGAVEVTNNLGTCP